MKKTLNWGIVSEYRNELFGLSAILVMICHAPNMKLPAHLVFASPILEHGNIGVDIFLFLSGMGLWFSFSKDQNIKNFYQKRIRRLLPPWICIAGPYFLIRDYAMGEGGFGQFVMDISTLSFWTNKRGMWFVSFILVCYLLFPFIFKALNNKNSLAITLIICIGLIAVNFFMYVYFIDCFMRLEIAIARGVIFILGCYFAPRIQQKKNIKIVVPASCLFLYLVARVAIVITMKDVPQVALKTTLIRYSYILAVISIIFFVPSILQWLDICFTNKVLKWFGTISMEIYLMHVSIMEIYILSPFGKEHMEVAYYFLLIIPVSIVLAGIVKYCTDIVMKKKSRKQKNH